MRRQILYFGNTWFTENRTSSHHIARWLGRDHDVFYFECPGLRAPNSSARDIRKAITQVARGFGGPVPGAPGVLVQPLLQIPFHRFALVRWLNRWLVRAKVRLTMWRNGISKPVVWCTVPHVASLVEGLPAAVSVYYCIDDYSALPGVDVDTVRQMDAELASHVDLVFVASETYLESKTRLNPNTHLSPHGVDVDHFGKGMLPPEPLPEIGIPRPPVIGFFGVVEKYLDVDLLDYLAASRPEWTFLIIGRVAIPKEQVPNRPNLLFVGPKPYESLPDYGRHFTVGIIPYRPTDFTYHANPLKLREYLAMGKPIVALRTPQTERFGDVIDVVTAREEWLQALDRAVATPQTSELVAARLRCIEQTSWDARLRSVWAIVSRWMDAPRPSSRTGSAPVPNLVASDDRQAPNPRKVSTL